MLITFVDGNKIGVYKNGKKELLESACIKRFEKSIQANKNAKKQYYEQAESEKDTDALLNCVIPCKDEKRCMYSVSVRKGGQTDAFVYYKNINAKDDEEVLFKSLSKNEVKTLCESSSGEIYATVQGINGAANICVLTKTELKSALPSLDWGYYENPTWNPEGDLMFNGYKIRDDRRVRKYLYENSEIQILRTDKKKPYFNKMYIANPVKPLYDKDGNFYCIRRYPKPKKSEPNEFVKFLTFPWVWTKAVIDFIKAKRYKAMDYSWEMQTRNGALEQDGKTMWINNVRVDIKKEAKRNQKYQDLGFVPAEWCLIKIEKGSEKVLAYGVADYDIAYEKGKTVLVYTNGSSVFKLTEKEFEVAREKLFDTERCVHLATLKY